MSARTATVQNVCALPGSPLKPITKGPVSAKCNTIAFHNDGSREVARHRYTDVDPVTGYWSMTLEINDDLDPANTYWIIKEPTGATWTVQLREEHAGLTKNVRAVLVTPPNNENPVFVVYGIGNVDGGGASAVYSNGLSMDGGAAA